MAGYTEAIHVTIRRPNGFYVLYVSFPPSSDPGQRAQKGEEMSLASGHHRIMVAARGALVMMVLGKVTEVCSRPQIPKCYSSVGSSKLTMVEG